MKIDPFEERLKSIEKDKIEEIGECWVDRIYG